MNEVKVQQQMTARPASDGDGVKLLRVFGGPQLQRFDPFLMLDEFGSDQAADYIGGFPAHPHRGFETVTYMLQGKMEHRDHLNNVGLLEDGGVQWMTAGKGIIHSEMPKQTEGRMRGFQLWVNLPADKKLQAAGYQDVAADNIPQYDLDVAQIKAIAGNTRINDTEVEGYFSIADTQVLYLDICLQPHQSITTPLKKGLNAMLYHYEGQLQISRDKVSSQAGTLTRLSGEGSLWVNNDSDSTVRFLLLAGQPLQQPIAQYGPFVMNTQQEIEQAINDYQQGILTD